METTIDLSEFIAEAVIINKNGLPQVVYGNNTIVFTAEDLPELQGKSDYEIKEYAYMVLMET